MSGEIRKPGAPQPGAAQPGAPQLGPLGPDDGYGHGSFERQDLAPGGVLYFLLALAVITVICMFGVKGFYALLEHKVRAEQPAVNPLIANVPTDTLHIPPHYPETAFPAPRLEEDERGQLNGIRTDWDNQLYTYGWVDESKGEVRIPIDRAMDLLVERGLPVRPEGAADGKKTTAGASEIRTKKESMQ